MYTFMGNLLYKVSNDLYCMWSKGILSYIGTVVKLIETSGGRFRCQF